MAITQDRSDRLSASFALFEPRLDAVVAGFTDRLAAAAPDADVAIAEMLDEHGEGFAAVVGRLGETMPDFGSIAEPLRSLGAGFAARGVAPDRYPLIREVWLAAMGDVADYAWTDRLESDWSAALDAMGTIMAEGAGSARTRAA
jgi:hemoglobin-like flavoprotein